MGMFDWLRVEAPLPNTPVPAPDGTIFQTKDTPDQYMTLHWITADGDLMWRPYEMEEVPKAERMYPDAPDDSLFSLLGCIRRVERDPERIDFHGDVEFYHYGDGGGWCYRARFTEGKLSRIDVVEFRAPDSEGSGE